MKLNTSSGKEREFKQRENYGTPQVDEYVENGCAQEEDLKSTGKIVRLISAIIVKIGQSISVNLSVQLAVEMESKSVPVSEVETAPYQRTDRQQQRDKRFGPIGALTHSILRCCVDKVPNL